MPATNSSNKKSEVELVSERVTKTKKEIEQLKAQLQKLIDSGINKTDFGDVASLNNESKTDITHNEPTANGIEKIAEAAAELQESKAKAFEDNISDVHSPEQPKVQSKFTVKRKNKSVTPQAIKEESPKKIRNYNQEAAREFIKKQREKRRESLKNSKMEMGVTEDLKKQRLRELREKSLQLLSKNIKHTRERSRSRSRDALDRQEPKHTHVNYEPLSQIKVKPAVVPNSNELKLTHPQLKNVTQIKVKPAVVPNSNELKLTHPQLKNVTVRSNVRDSNAIAKLDVPKHIQFDINNLPMKVTTVNPPSIDSACSISSFHHNTEEQQTYTKSRFPIPPSTVHNVTKQSSLKSSKPTQIQKHKAAIAIQTAFRGYLQKKLYRIALDKKRHTKEQATKEVQTVNIPHEIPEWLKAPPTMPYPYNFINTVKRKLNLAIQQPTTVNDVAVQSSIIDENITSSAKLKNSIKLKNSDLKSFLSHKCLDLDVEAIKPLALTRKSSHDKKDYTHKSILKSKTHEDTSESDTSKNIPELSSEGNDALLKKHHSSKRAHSSDTDHDEKPKINTEKIKKLKLLHPKRLNFSIGNIKPHQSSNHTDEEISEHISAADSGNKRKSISLSHLDSAGKDNFSGRDSIISSNKCNYSQTKTPESHLELRNEIFLEYKSKSIPPEDAVSSLKNHMKRTHKHKPTESNDSTIETEMSLKQEGKELENSKSKEALKSSEISTRKSQSKCPQKKVNSNEVETFEEYSSSFTNVPTTATISIPSLTRPTVSLKSSQKNSNLKYSNIDDDEKGINRIIIQPSEKSTETIRGKSRNIHVKFEAELHLLNEFNDSLRQIMAMDKSLMELRNTNSKIQIDKTTATYHTRDTQTSFTTKSSTDDEIVAESLQNVPEDSTCLQNKTQIEIPTINYSRGSDNSEDIDFLSLNNTAPIETHNDSLFTTGLEISELKDGMLTSCNEENNVDISVSIAKENRYNKNYCTGLSLEVFEQLITDEDARIENLKTILKIREKSLVDRTKGELAWLEIQKKHLRDSGQLQEISAIKKKQRGLLIKLEHERHEMQRLKQMQKAASKERKSALREQRNMIKAQLSNASTMITKIKRNAKEEKRSTGPLKVYNIKSHSESIRSETSMSRRSSVAEEIISVVSHTHHSVVSHITEEAIIPKERVQEITSEIAPIPSNTQIKSENVKQSLLMREAALQKRRKAAEELLQWHQRLIEEEEKIAELEQAASAIINQIPTVSNSMVSDEPSTEKHKFKGTQLNLLWCNMTGREEEKFNDNMTYTMSKISLERFCKDAKKYAINRNKSFHSKKSGKLSDSDSSLSAMDITVTELTHSKLRSNSNSEKYKNKSKSLQSASEITSQIVVPRSTSRDSQEYTSEFNSLVSNNKEPQPNLILTDADENSAAETTALSSIQNDNSDSNISLASEISISDKHIESIIELSKTRTTHLGLNENDVTQQSKTAIIDDTSSANTFIPEKIINADSKMNGVNAGPTVDKNKLKVTNQDSTSKDISTDIEFDDNKSEILNDTQEIDEVTSSSNQQTEIRSKIMDTVNNVSLEPVPSASISDEETWESISQSSSVKEGIISENGKQNKNPSVDLILSETIKTEDPSLNSDKQPTENQSAEVVEEIELSKEEEPILTDDNSSLSEGKNQLISKISKEHNTSDTNETKVASELEIIEEIEMSSRLNEISSHIEEDHSNESIPTDDNSSFSEDKNQFISKASVDHLSETVVSEIEVVEENEMSDEIKLIDKKAIPSHTGEESIESILTEDANSLSEDHNGVISKISLISETDQIKVASELQPSQLLENLNEANQDRSIKSILTDYTSSSQYKDLMDVGNNPNEINQNQLSQSITSYDDSLLNQHNTDQLSSKINENIIETNNDSSNKSTITEHSLVSQSKTIEAQSIIAEKNESPNRTDQLFNKTDENIDEINEDLSNKSVLTDLSILSEHNDQLFNKSNQDLVTEIDESFTEANENESMATRESEPVNELDRVDKTYENSETDDDTESNLLSQTDTNQPLDNQNENQQIKINESDLLSKDNNNIDKPARSSDSCEHHLKNKSNDELIYNTKEKCIEDLNDPKEELGTSSHSEILLNKSSNKETPNKILVENKPNECDIKAIESDEDTDIISDAEWNEVSEKGEQKKPPENIQIKSDEKEDGSIKSTTTTTSTSRNVESPLLLSYGFVEDKEPEDQTENESSTLNDDHIEDLHEDTSEKESLQNNVNTEVSLAEKIYHDDDAFKDNNISHTPDLLEESDTSDNQLEEKFEIDLNQTYAVEPTETKHIVDVTNDEEIDTPPQDPKKNTTDVEFIDVKKRVSEILADVNIPSPRGDKSPRVQDLYITAYDVVSPEQSSSSSSPTEDLDQTFTPPHPVYGIDEVEELLKKQLEIEQEIKEIQQQQQKEHIPYLYVREIPNKPPPPYTPPVIIQTPVSGGILPVTENQIGIIAEKAAGILQKAYLERNLQNVTISVDDQLIMQNKHNIDKTCFEFIFDLCKEAAIEHYKQFETETGPSWMHLTKRSKLAIGKPPDVNNLQTVINTKVKQWLGYEIVKSTENIKRKWSGKKRDHVDELLVLECQAEEAEWTNYDRDELIVKDELTKDIMNMLLSETAQVFNKILNKKTL